MRAVPTRAATPSAANARERMPSVRAIGTLPNAALPNAAWRNAAPQSVATNGGIGSRSDRERRMPRSATATVTIATSEMIGTSAAAFAIETDLVAQRAASPTSGAAHAVPLVAFCTLRLWT